LSIIIVSQNWFAKFSSLHFAKVLGFIKNDYLIINYFWSMLCRKASYRWVYAANAPKRKLFYSQSIFCL